eukprot:s1373_g12.t1
MGSATDVRKFEKVVGAGLPIGIWSLVLGWEGGVEGGPGKGKTRWIAGCDRRPSRTGNPDGELEIELDVAGGGGDFPAAGLGVTFRLVGCWFGVTFRLVGCWFGGDLAAGRLGWSAAGLAAGLGVTFRLVGCWFGLSHWWVAGLGVTFRLTFRLVGGDLCVTFRLVGCWFGGDFLAGRPLVWGANRGHFLAGLGWFGLVGCWFGVTFQLVGCIWGDFPAGRLLVRFGVIFRLVGCWFGGDFPAGRLLVWGDFPAGRLLVCVRLSGWCAAGLGVTFQLVGCWFGVTFRLVGCWFGGDLAAGRLLVGGNLAAGRLLVRG